MSTTTPTDLRGEAIPIHWRVRNGARIITRREDKGLSQLELAERCGVTQQTISRTERGETDPRWWLKDRIAAVLDTTVDELFGSGVGVPA